MKWIIENFVGDNGYEDLIAEAKKQSESGGFEVVVLDIRNHFELQINPENECIVFQGSIQLAKKLKAELKSCYPVAWNTSQNYLATSYYPKLGQYLFNDFYAILPAGELERQRWDYYRIFGKDTMMFVRPNDGDKSFTGGLIDLQDFDKTWKKNYEYGLRKEDLVIVSTPKKMQGEWRFICTDKQEIIAQSCYVFQGNRTYIPFAPPKATELVKKILTEGYYPDKVFTVDIVMDADGNFWLMELNSFSSAGTYACNKEAIVKRVTEIAKEEFNDRISKH